MYAASFSYHRATSLADAHRLLAAHPGAKLLAGGHSLIPAMKLRLATPEAVVDIGRVAELRGITGDTSGVRIGALTTHVEVASSGVVSAACHALTDAAGRVGDPAVRNRGTIGGSAAHADPGADEPTVLVAAGARMEIASATGTRSVPAAEFFQGLMATALGDGEILTAIVLPSSAAGRGSAYEKFAHPASRYAVIGVAAVVSVAGGKCSAASVVVGGLTHTPRRLASVEAALVGSALSADTISSAAGKAAGDLTGDLMGDVFASAEFRRATASVYVARAITTAAARAK